MGVIGAVVPGRATRRGDGPAEDGSVMAVPAADWRAGAAFPDRVAHVEAFVARRRNNRSTPVRLLMAVPSRGGPAMGVPAAVVVADVGDGEARAAGDHPGEHQDERRSPAARTPAGALHATDHHGQAGDDDKDLGGGGEPVEEAERFPHSQFATSW